MGSHASATICFGAPAPEEWTLEDAQERLPIEGPLQYVVEGGYDWPDEDQRILLCVRDAGRTAWESAEPLSPLPWETVDVRSQVNAGKLYRHLTGEEFQPRWWLVPFFG